MEKHFCSVQGATLSDKSPVLSKYELAKIVSDISAILQSTTNAPGNLTEPLIRTSKVALQLMMENKTFSINVIRGNITTPLSEFWISKDDLASLEMMPN